MILIHNYMLTIGLDGITIYDVLEYKYSQKLISINEFLVSDSHPIQGGRSMKKITFLLIVLLLGGIFIFGCSSTPTFSTTPSKTPVPATSTTPAAAPVPASSITSEEPIKIGALLELTGANAINGPVQKAAIEFKLSQVNSQAAGRKIQVIIEDNATDPVVGVDKAKKLVQSDKVDMVMGPVHGAVSGAVANYIKNIGIPNIQLMPHPSELLKLGGGNIFLPFGADAANGYYLGLYTHDKLGYKSAVAINEDFVSGETFVTATSKAFQKQGGTVIQKILVPSGTADFGSYVSTIKQADCVIFWFTPVLAQRFVTQYFATGLKAPLILPAASVLLPQLLGQIGDKAVGIVGSQVYTSLIDTPMNKAYVDDFMKKYQMVPIATSVVADVAMSQYFEALKTTNGDATPAKIIDALHKIKVTTPAGVFSYTSDNLGVGDQYILKVVKVQDRYDWGVLDKYSQIPLDAPAQ